MKIIGLDCEMIGVYPNDTNSLARVSIVNDKSVILYDKYVRQSKRVYSYRTNITGIVKENLTNAKKFENVRKDVINLLKNSILVGHAIEHDLEILDLTPELLFDIDCKVRDTSVYGYFRRTNPNCAPSLKSLASTFLNRNIQQTTHSSVEDAHAAVLLYMSVRDMWESEVQWYERWNRCDEEESEESYESEESD